MDLTGEDSQGPSVRAAAATPGRRRGRQPPPLLEHDREVIVLDASPEAPARSPQRRRQRQQQRRQDREEQEEEAAARPRPAQQGAAAAAAAAPARQGILGKRAEPEPEVCVPLGPPMCARFGAAAENARFAWRLGVEMWGRVLRPHGPHVPQSTPIALRVARRSPGHSAATSASTMCLASSCTPLVRGGTASACAGAARELRLLQLQLPPEPVNKRLAPPNCLSACLPAAGGCKHSFCMQW